MARTSPATGWSTTCPVTRAATGTPMRSSAPTQPGRIPARLLSSPPAPPSSVTPASFGELSLESSPRRLPPPRPRRALADLQGSRPETAGREEAAAMRTSFTPEEIEYLSGERRLGRLATVQPDGLPHVVPVGWSYNPDLGTIDISGRN